MIQFCFVVDFKLILPGSLLAGAKDSRDCVQDSVIGERLYHDTGDTRTNMARALAAKDPQQITSIDILKKLFLKAIENSKLTFCPFMDFQIFAWRYKDLLELEKNPPKDFQLETLDSYKEQEKLHKVIQFIFDKLVSLKTDKPLIPEFFDNFGADIAFWLVLNDRMQASENIRQLEYLGFDGFALKSAFVGLRAIQTFSKSALLKKAYYLVKAIVSEKHFDDFNLSSAIKESLFIDKSRDDKYLMSKKQLAEYSLKPTTCNKQSLNTVMRMNTSDWRYIKSNWMNGGANAFAYLDAPIGLALTYQGKPAALVTMMPIDKNTLKLIQIQTIKATRTGQSKAPPGLGNFKWQKVLLEASMHLARKLGYSRFAIAAADQCIELKLTDKLTPEKRREVLKARKNYDEFADDQGFDQAVPGADWLKPLLPLKKPKNQ